MTTKKDQTDNRLPMPDGQWLYAVPGMDRVYVTEDGQTVYGTDPKTGELRPLTQYVRENGTASVWTATGNVGVHQLMCRTFHGEAPSARHIVARNNGNTRDNRPENLRWDTRWNAAKSAFNRRNPPKTQQKNLTASAPPTERQPRKTRQRPWETAMREYQNALAEKGMTDPLDGPPPKSTDFDDE